MSTIPKRPSRKTRTSYHHGDLRAALIDAAKTEVERAGADAVSLKALATSLGVSAPAPYRHFVDRDALLVAVALEGFLDFTAALARADGDLEAMAHAYVEFGRSRGGLYRLMFVAPVLSSSDHGSELRAAARGSFDLLLEAVARVVPAERARLIAFSVWSSLHGLVMLENAGILSSPIAEGLDPWALVQAACNLAAPRS